jgi:hypothetical protein
VVYPKGKQDKNLAALRGYSRLVCSSFLPRVLLAAEGLLGKHEGQGTKKHEKSFHM